MLLYYAHMILLLRRHVFIFHALLPCPPTLMLLRSSGIRTHNTPRTLRQDAATTAIYADAGYADVTLFYAYVSSPSIFVAFMAT